MSVEARSRVVIEGIERIGPEFFIYVPDSSAAKVFEHFIDSPAVTDFPMTKEEEGIGILSGLALSGRRAVMFIQDTGFGNSITALTTFAAAYHVPIFIAASRTGGAKEINSAVHAYSDPLPEVLRAANIYCDLLDRRTPLDRWPGHIAELYEYAHTSHKPVVALMDLKGGDHYTVED